MPTVLIVIIVVIVPIVFGVLLFAASRRKRTQLIAEAQVQAKHHDLSRYRNQARDARAEAEIAEERAERAAAEADLNERRAGGRERELEGGG